MRAAILCLALFIQSPKWGFAQFADLRGQVLLEGGLPENVRASPLLTVNPANQGVANVFVYVRKPTVINPDLAAIPKEPVTISALPPRFLPHTMIVRCGQQVIFDNPDGSRNNLHAYSVFNAGVDITLAAGDQAGIEIPVANANARREPLPIMVRNDLHSGMDAFWLVVDHPYAAVATADGDFTIPGLPVGKNTLTVWHSTVGYLAKTYEIDIAPEGTRLKPILVQAELADGVAKLKRLE